MRILSVCEPAEDSEPFFGEKVAVPMTYSWYELCFYFLLYSFLGWCVETAFYAVARRGFYNRGILTLPFLPSYGVSFLLLILVLPSLGNHYFLQYLGALVIVSVVESMAGFSLRRAGKKLRLNPERSRLFSGSGRGMLASAAVAAGYYLVYLVVHPLLIALTLLLPDLLLRVTDIALLAALGLDLLSMLAAVRLGDSAGRARRQQNLARRISDGIWRRLQTAYPGGDTAEETAASVFAPGLCLDKLIWVFLISAILGCGIEFLYCGLVDGQWMNRSSVLYGPFSFVWGFGAVVLTVTLQRLAEKNDRYVFLSGFLIGGAYEYMCSVITELAFGTVFWDYSDMPLNIGGRTNALFCFFWGILAVVWVKMLYPPMSRGIERIPVLAGRIVTWALVFFMACNALLTGAAMLRYRARAENAPPANALDQLLDRQYDDNYMERHWPNMVITD